MIKALVLLAVLFDTSLCLSEKGRMELAKPLRTHKGIDLGKRHERLRNLGLKMGLNSAEVNSTSTVDGTATAQRRIRRYFLAVANRQYIRTVLKYLQQRTCLNFVESATAPARIKVISGSGCYSFVGYLGREQELSLGSGCIIVGTVAHEFTHALGSMHTHMRSDRDKYVTVDLTNVTESYRNNFVKSSSSINSVPYEYGSDMHYQSNAFSTSGNSLKPAQPRFQRTMG
ncbi:astacin, partial [Ostertagia ostertagi]